MPRRSPTLRRWRRGTQAWRATCASAEMAGGIALAVDWLSYAFCIVCGAGGAAPRLGAPCEAATRRQVGLPCCVCRFKRFHAVLAARDPDLPPPPRRQVGPCLAVSITSTDSKMRWRRGTQTWCAMYACAATAGGTAFAGSTMSLAISVLPNSLRCRMCSVCSDRGA